MRTMFKVERSDRRQIEIIEGGQAPWRFRPHFHAGDEIVRLLAGRARLRLPTISIELGKGDTVVVPAGTVHRFEPLDDKGWAFSSQFAMPLAMTRLPGAPDAVAGEGLVSRAMWRLADRATLRTEPASIARQCGVSAGYLSRAFRRSTGTSLHNFQVLLALHRTKAQLRDGAGLSQAALDGGFYDQAHLTREFVRTYGMTPGAFRAAWADR